MRGLSCALFFAAVLMAQPPIGRVERCVNLSSSPPLKGFQCGQVPSPLIIRRPTTSFDVPGNVGADLYAGDEILVAENAHAVLTIRAAEDWAEISLGPGARFKVAELRSFWITLGWVWLNLRGRFEVRSQHMIFGPRGTQFFVDVKADSVRMAVKEGAVEVRESGSQNRLTVESNQEVEFQGGRVLGARIQRFSSSWNILDLLAGSLAASKRERLAAGFGIKYRLTADRNGVAVLPPATGPAYLRSGDRVRLKISGFNPMPVYVYLISMNFPGTGEAVKPYQGVTGFLSWLSRAANLGSSDSRVKLAASWQVASGQVSYFPDAAALVADSASGLDKFILVVAPKRLSKEGLLAQAGSMARYTILAENRGESGTNPDGCTVGCEVHVIALDDRKPFIEVIDLYSNQAK